MAKKRANELVPARETASDEASAVVRENPRDEPDPASGTNLIIDLNQLRALGEEVENVTVTLSWRGKARD